MKRSVLTRIDDIEDALICIIDGAENELVMTSPYVQLQVSKEKKWTGLFRAIREAVSRGVKVTFISRTMDAHNRTDAMKVLKPFRELGCSVFLVSNLHAKVYYNGKEALITSLNLYMGSTFENKEIAVTVKDDNELLKIRRYLASMVGNHDKKSVNGGRVVSRRKTPKGMKETWFKVTKKARKYYYIRLEGKYPGRTEIDGMDDNLTTGKSYDCKCKVNWRTMRGKKRVFLDSVSSVQERN